jgi:hypothetical protein
MCFPFSIIFFLLQYKYCMLLIGNQVLWKHQWKCLQFKSTRADSLRIRFVWNHITNIIPCLIRDSNPGPLGFKSAMLSHWDRLIARDIMSSLNLDYLSLICLTKIGVWLEKLPLLNFDDKIIKSLKSQSNPDPLCRTAWGFESST